MEADAVSISESSTKQSSAGKNTDKAELALSKKKLKVLKQALKDQKDLTDKAEQSLKNAQNEIENLKQQNLEKDKKYKSLFDEKTNLEDTILKGNKPAGDLRNTNYGSTMNEIKNKMSKPKQQ